MTRSLLVLLVAAILLCGAAATAPAPVAGAALMPRPAVPVAPAPLVFDVRIGDGVIQVRIRGCAAGNIAVTVVIDLPPVFHREARAAS